MPTGQPIEISKEFLEEEYVRKCKSSRQIAAELGCDKKVILERLKKYEIPIKRDSPNFCKDITGLKFNKLIAKKCIGKYKGKITWECECECGNILNVCSASLRSGHTKSCGCHKQNNFLFRNKYIGDISGTWYNRVRNSALNRGYEFLLTPEDIWDIYLQQNKKCALSGLDIFFPKTNKDDITNNATCSLDRVDSNLGYTKENCQLLHKVVNMAKQHFDEDVFVFISTLVAKNLKNYDLSIEDNLLLRARKFIKRIKYKRV